jgi:transposase
MSKEIISYSGKKIYVGIDVHKESYTLVCVCEKQVVKKVKCKAEPLTISQSLSKWFEGATIFSVYEAGFSGFVLHRALEDKGVRNIVVNPASIAVKANDKVKTDKRDATKMAIDLADGRLRGIYIPTVQEEQRRLLQRTRAMLVDNRTRASRQIKSRLHQFGLISPLSKRLISNKYLRELEAADLPDDLKSSLHFLFEQWRFFTKQLIEIRNKMREQALADSALEKVYRSVPGIGEVIARTFATELGDMKRFANEKQLFSYTGLTPGEYSSGNNVRRGHISRQGSARIRHLLIETAWRVIEKDSVLHDSFLRIAGKRGKKRAIVAVARRLIGRIRACFNSGTLYVGGTHV